MNGLLVSLNCPKAVSNSSSVYLPTLVLNSITKMSLYRTALLYSSCSLVCEIASKKSSQMTSSRYTPWRIQSLFWRLTKLSNSCRSSFNSEEEARNIFLVFIDAVQSHGVKRSCLHCCARPSIFLRHSKDCGL